MRVFRLIAVTAGAVAVLAVLPSIGSSDSARPRQAKDCGRVEYLSQLEVVFGRAKTIAAANRLRTRVATDGFANAEVLPECGDYKVTVRGEESFDIAVDLQSEARRVHFNATIECIKGKDDVGELEVVFGHRRDRATAADLVALATSEGFRGVQLESDPCGGFEIVFKGFSSRAQADDFVAEAKGAGFNPIIEKS